MAETPRTYRICFTGAGKSGKTLLASTLGGVPAVCSMVHGAKQCTFNIRNDQEVLDQETIKFFFFPDSHSCVEDVICGCGDHCVERPGQLECVPARTILTMFDRMTPKMVSHILQCRTMRLKNGEKILQVKHD
jgi:hypothetical protein